MSITALLRAAVCALVGTLAACGGSSSNNSTGSTSSSTSSSSNPTGSASSSSAATLALSASQYTVAPAATAVLRVSLVGASAGTTTASCTTYNGTAKAGTDYTGPDGTLTWNAGDTSSRTVSIPVARSAAGKTFGIALTSVAGRATFGSPTSATVAVTGGSAAALSSPSSSSTSGSSSSGATTVSTQASALLNYMTGLGSDSRHILTGQHTSYWDSNPLDNIQALYSQTGTYPAILGTTLSMTGSPENGVALANQWIAKGGIVLVSLWSDDPAGGVYNAAYSGSNFSDVYTPGTAVNTAWNAYLDKIAAQLKTIKRTSAASPIRRTRRQLVLVGPAADRQIHRAMAVHFERDMVTDGVTNALWVYNVNAYSGNYTAYYPGSAYVDIVSWDSYPPTPIDRLWYNALVGLGKPIILAETGVLSSNNSAVAPYAGNTNELLQLVKASFPKVVAMVVWCQNAALSKQQGAESFMTDSAVFNLADLAGAL